MISVTGDFKDYAEVRKLSISHEADSKNDINNVTGDW